MGSGLGETIIREGVKQLEVILLVAIRAVYLAISISRAVYLAIRAVYLACGD